LKTFCGVALGGEGANEAFCGYVIQHWSGNDFDRAQRTNELNETQQAEFRNGLNQQYGQDKFGSLAERYLSSNGLIPWSAQNRSSDRIIFPMTYRRISTRITNKCSTPTGKSPPQKNTPVF
jgi:hypothetical protein